MRARGTGGLGEGNVIRCNAVMRRGIGQQAKRDWRRAMACNGCRKGMLNGTQTPIVQHTLLVRGDGSTARVMATSIPASPTTGTRLVGRVSPSSAQLDQVRALFASRANPATMQGAFAPTLQGTRVAPFAAQQEQLPGLQGTRVRPPLVEPLMPAGGGGGGCWVSPEGLEATCCSGGCCVTVSLISGQIVNAWCGPFIRQRTID